MSFRRAAMLLLAAAFIAPLCVRAEEAVPNKPVPELAPGKNWENFTIMIGYFHTDPIENKALYESVNLHAFQIDQMKVGQLAAFGKTNNWPFYIDHAAGKGYLHLNKKVELPHSVDIIARPNSLNDPKTISTMRNLLKENIEKCKGSSVLAYSFDDEISLGKFCSPYETDGSPGTVALYRKQLEKNYKSIDKLNAQYGTNYKSFASISPKSYEAFRKEFTSSGLGKVNLSQWNDWRAFMDDTLSDTLADLTRYANSLDATVPAGFVGGQMPSAWGGFDYRKLTKSVQWMEAYDIGASNEILRSFWDQKHAHIQTFFSSGNPHKDSWFLWYYLCHGNRGVVVWPEVKNDNWFKDGKVHDRIVPLAPTFKETQGPLSQKIINGQFMHDPVAIYYSQPSIRMTWAMDAVSGGKTWPKRGSSIDNRISTANLTRIGWLKTMEDLGIQAKFIHQDHLLGGALLKDGYKVLLLSHILCLSDAEAAAIREFSDKGGVVIADHLCGIFDEHGKARPSGALDDLFGVKRSLGKGILDGKTLTEVDGERDMNLSEKSWVSQGVPVYKDMLVYERGLSAAGPAKADATQGGAAVVVRNGKNIYLNLSTVGYMLKRPMGGGGAWLDFAAGLFSQAGVTPRLKLFIDGKPAAITEPIFWKNGDTTTLCVVKNIDRKATINSFGSTDGGAEESKVKLKLVFAQPVNNLKNERTGKDLGSGKEFEDEFTPWEANVYTYR